MLALEVSRAQGVSAAWQSEIQLRLESLCQQLRSKLESTKQWEPAVQRLLSLPDSFSLLIYVISEMQKPTRSFEIQPSVAKALVNAVRRDSNAVPDDLLPLLSSLAENEVFDSLHEDLKIAVTAAICRYRAPEDRHERIQALHEALRQDNVMTDSELLTSFQQLSVCQPISCTGPRRRKRRKMNQGEHESSPDSIIRRTTKLLTGIESEDLTALPDMAAKVYGTLDKEEQCAVWQALIDLSKVHLNSAIAVMSQLIGLPVLHKTNHQRVLSMLGVRACIEKTMDPTCLKLESSAFGQFCLGSLQSSLRELRIAAGQSLPSFVRSDLPQELKTANRTTALQFLRALSDRDVSSHHETLIPTWGQVALTCDDSELNLVLLQLVDYLGHSNPLIFGLAFSELEKLAVAREQSMDELFRPFWSSISVSVVQELQSRPQKAQQLCDLLGVDVSQWLIATQQDTIPTLVLTKKKNTLLRIAAARGSDTSVIDLILQPRTNLASTLALLLAQPGADSEEAALTCLAEVSPEFRGRDISDFVKIDSTLVACYMLKYMGDQGGSRKSRAYQGFHTFANIAERRPGQAKAYSKSSKAVTEFFDNHILGIMTYFSGILEDAQGVNPTHEKIRCIKAINEMITMDKQHVNAALPQIRAALQSAMEQAALCETAASTWLNLLCELQSDDIAHVVDQSFALILRHWWALSPELQQATHERVSQIVRDHSQVIQDNVLKLPSLKEIPLLSKIGGEIERLQSGKIVEDHCRAFSNRLRNEGEMVVLRALRELIPFLEKHDEFVHDSAVSEQPAAVLSDLIRALLDATSKYAAESEEAADLCGKALGIIGCLDPNRVEATRKKRRLLVLSNFDKASEVIDWAIVLLEDVLVKAFKSVSNARAQGFLAYVMQELLRFCEFDDGAVLRPRASQAPSVHQKWMDMPEHVRITLTPFVRSKYVVASNVTIAAPNRAYPSFSPDSGHSAWLRSLVYDLMWKGKGDNAKMVFPLLARVIRGHDLAIASFMLPYVMLNVVLGGTITDVKGVSDELLAVLGCQPSSSVQQECVKLCSESVFNALDYMSTWLQEKRKALGETRAAAFRTGNSPNDFDEAHDMAQIDTAERFLASIPAEVIATQAVVCGSYARALFHWEQYIRQERPLIPSARPPKQFSDDEMLYDKLQDIYSQIDEPDGLEGISAHLPFLNEEQQAMQHAKAGRWTAAQAWYESQLADMPQNVDLEERLIGCLRETGRYAPLLRYADSFLASRTSAEDTEIVKTRLLPAVVEAYWTTADLQGMKTYLDDSVTDASSHINVGVGRLLATVANGPDDPTRVNLLRSLRKAVTQGMTVARTSSIQTSHEDLKKLHVLYEIDALSSGVYSMSSDPTSNLERRLSVLGSYVSDKQHVLGVRRAVMYALQEHFNDADIGSSWLATAKLARQLGNTQQAYDAVLQAHECGDQSAKLEEARLLWRDGHQRHAIQSLESAIASGVFETTDTEMSTRPDQSGVSSNLSAKQDMLSAKANLLLAKWLDASGQRQSNDMTEKYQFAAKHFQRWEKGHYYLGKHYQKLLEAEKVLPKHKQCQQFQTGELTRLVIDNQLRSVPFGNKYWHQTIPKILTLWLDLGLETIKMTRGEDQGIFDRRVKALQTCNKQLQKYFDRVPPYVFHSAMPQMISRITHPNPEVWKQLSNILTRIVSANPSQALWSLLAVIKASDRVRVERGMEILNRLKDQKSKSKSDSANVDLRVMIAQGQRLLDGLLHACEAPVEQRVSNVSLSKDLGFNHKLAPSPLVVPIEMTLTLNLPSGANHETIKKYKDKAFAQDKVTIQSFSDSVLVLSSLQRPRKITVRGSDGKQYGLLCKPKDDLRKDQRLMEFNGIINRALKRDAESSKRRLYIKTYAVTPLSEESGIIEWVEGIKPIRDILLNIYARKGIRPNYPDIRRTLDEASAGPQHAHIFIEKVLPRFPACLHEWFTEIYPEPDAWFAARLRYARSAAVMSMTGHMLGLGDRHGENILLEESTGGVFHVDFNCLFDKGLTFEKPELVPFRLTHNMVDAMGPYGYEGPFRKSCELTLRMLRQNKDTLMTILETFLYDPTTDFVGKKKKSTAGVPETPQEILDSVDGKLKGLLRGESVPLGVEGYVDTMIREATSPRNLASMYIGWCAFL